MYTGDRSFKGFYEDANWTFLEERAYIYENWTDQYNICKEEWDCATTLTETYFKSGITSPFYNYEQYVNDTKDFLYNKTSKFRDIKDVNPIDGYGDSPMWTGNYMASLAFHYAVECENDNVDEANEILRKLKRPVDGLNILTHVSGLDGNLVRFAIKDTEENRERFQGFFYKLNEDETKLIEKEFGREDNTYLGQGDYEDWWYTSRTSRDQHIGLFFGYGITYKILSETDAPAGVDKDLRDEILETIGDDGTDVLDCLIGANWNVINGEEEIGGGRGTDEASLYPRIPWTSGGDIILAFLSFGKLVNPNKYTKYYNNIINRFLTTIYHYSADQSGGYYGNNLAFESLFLGYFLQEDEEIREIIKWHFNNDYYVNIQFHRNSFFNLGWMIINDYDLDDDILSDKRLTYRLDDITDNLNRVARWRYPSRAWHIPRVADADDLEHPKAKLYSEIFAEDSKHILNILYGWLFREFADTSQKSMIALGADELGSTDFIWQRNPFSIGGTYADIENYPGYRQNAGVDYTLPYWMGRFFGYFEEP